MLQPSKAAQNKPRRSTFVENRTAFWKKAAHFVSKRSAVVRGWDCFCNIPFDLVIGSVGFLNGQGDHV
jgi:hypothetical protein